MPSKKSKRPTAKPSLWKAAPSCSEGSVRAIAHELASVLRPGDIVSLEGGLGAGKSTFASAVLEALGADRPPEGSPTFPLVHRYPLKAGAEALHIDLYRLKSEGEIEAAGILEDLWNLDAIVLVEWLSLWPETHSALMQEPVSTGRKRYLVSLAFPSSGDVNLRDLKIDQL